MKKKIVSALLCVAMAASLVVGCGSKSGSDSGSSKGGDKLVYWAMWSEDEPQAKVIKEAISKYEKDTGVKVDVQFKGRTGQREGLEPALSAKQQIDLFDYSRRGNIILLSSLIKTARICYTQKCFKLWVIHHRSPPFFANLLAFSLSSESSKTVQSGEHPQYAHFRIAFVPVVLRYSITPLLL